MTQVDVELHLSSSFKRELCEIGGAAVVHLLQKACDEYATTGGITDGFVNEAYEKSWEALHCGSWKTIASQWRQAFGFASLLKALALCQQEKHIEALRILDLCLMMSGPYSVSSTHGLVSSIEDKIMQRDINSEKETNKPPSSNEPPKKIARLTKSYSSQNPLDFPVKRVACPSLSRFYEEFMRTNTPIIVTGAMDHWPARSRERSWSSLDYLRQIAGLRTVPVEIGSNYLNDDWSQKLMTINEFIDKYIEQTDVDSKDQIGYLAQHHLFDQIPRLRQDIATPDYCTLQRDEDAVEEDIAINSWFGPKGTVSPLHFDPKDNLLCQVVGAKYLRLYSPAESERLYPVPGLLSNTSQVQVEAPNLDQFPGFAKASYMECVLEPGEMLYIPPRYWHYVRSLDTSFSVSFWWT